MRTHSRGPQVIFWVAVIGALLSTSILFLVQGTSLLQSLQMFSHGLFGTDSEILITGDIMLSRDVEQRMNTHSATYPYQYMESLFAEHKYQLGNFEGSIPETHIPTASGGFTFSVKAAYAQALIERGFTHLSLANNHSDDFGTSGLEYTRSTIASLGASPIGQPYEVATSSLVYIEDGASTVAVLAFDLTLAPLDTDAVSKLFDTAKENSDIEIVYIHWGTEYGPVHTQTQRAYAELFAQLGAELVIGHHPHVVQDIERIDDTLVFYSLGNFIFDQYFSTEVQQGLLLSFDPIAMVVRLLPVSSIDSRNAPRQLEGEELTNFLNALAEKSDTVLYDEIIAGALTL